MDTEFEKVTFMRTLHCDVLSLESKHSFQKSIFSQLGMGYNQFAKGLSFGKKNSQFKI